MSDLMMAWLGAPNQAIRDVNMLGAQGATNRQNWPPGATKILLERICPNMLSHCPSLANRSKQARVADSIAPNHQPRKGVPGYRPVTV
jgi:hypothetical protein